MIKADRFQEKIQYGEKNWETKLEQQTADQRAFKLLLPKSHSRCRSIIRAVKAWRGEVVTQNRFIQAWDLMRAGDLMALISIAGDMGYIVELHDEEDQHVFHFKTDQSH